MAGILVAGTSSDAGKSLVTAGLCRVLRCRGVDVAPFKAQNMSNNSMVVADGEIGRAQFLQAIAAGVEPSTAMNPVLIKPGTDRRAPAQRRHHRIGGVLGHRLQRRACQLRLVELVGQPATQVREPATGLLQVARGQVCGHQFTLARQRASAGHCPGGQRGQPHPRQRMPAPDALRGHAERGQRRQAAGDVHRPRGALVAVGVPLHPHRPGAEPGNRVVASRVGHDGIGEGSQQQAGCPRPHHAAPERVEG